MVLLGILSRNVPNVGALMTPNEAVAENIWLARVTCVQEKLVGAIDSIGVVYKQKCLSPFHQTSRSAKEGFRCRNPTNHYICRQFDGSQQTQHPLAGRYILFEINNGIVIEMRSFHFLTFKERYWEFRAEKGLWYPLVK